MSTGARAGHFVIIRIKLVFGVILCFHSIGSILVLVSAKFSEGFSCDVELVNDLIFVFEGSEFLSDINFFTAEISGDVIGSWS